jgi:hypothetical protein
MDTIVIFVHLRKVTTIFNFEKIPLQLCVHLMDAITPTFTAYTSQYIGYSQPYVRIDGGVFQNQRIT